MNTNPVYYYSTSDITNFVFHHFVYYRNRKLPAILLFRFA